MRFPGLCGIGTAFLLAMQESKVLLEGASKGSLEVAQNVLQAGRKKLTKDRKDRHKIV